MRTYDGPSRCVECARLRGERERAHAAGDPSRATDCAVLLRRHQAALHRKAAGR